MTPPFPPFLNPPPAVTDFTRAKAVVVPFPYEGGVSYGAGASGAPRAVLEASGQLEFFDAVLNAEPLEVGIATVQPPIIPSDPEGMLRVMQQTVEDLLDLKKFIVVIGGDHSISSGFARALKTRYDTLGVIQLDAHADLRDTYEGSPFSHACVMARIREITPDTLQFGVRSLSTEEARRVQRETLSLCTLHQWRSKTFSLEDALARLPEAVFITFDVDVFDWSVIGSTGTPEPGGLLWDETLTILRRIFETKTIVGCDVVELAFREGDLNGPFAVAKLIYNLIGFKFLPNLTPIL